MSESSSHEYVQLYDKKQDSREVFLAVKPSADLVNRLTILHDCMIDLSNAKHPSDRGSDINGQF